jgi:hypothetical protein
MDVPLATFAIWKREARRAASERVGFARVDVVPTTTGSPAEARAGIRLVVRGTAGHEAALDGVDGETAVPRRACPWPPMIGLTSGRPIFLATGTTDLRKSFTGLYALVRERLAQEPLSVELTVPDVTLLLCDRSDADARAPAVATGSERGWRRRRTRVTAPARRRY